MAQERSLEGEVALVTGASSGIGRETASQLAEAGADVALAARREDRLRELQSELAAAFPVETLVVPTDVSDEDEVDAMVDACVSSLGRLDTLVNNAATGTARGVPVEELTTEQYRTVMSVNTDGMFFSARAALPHIRATSGTMVFVGSFAGQYPRPGGPVYAATKWWTRGFALSLAGQVGDDGVAVSVVNPSEVRTEFGKEFRAEEDLSKHRYEPGTVTEPSEVAEAIVFVVEREQPSTIAELDIYRRDKFASF